jgi:hypothetical protein
VFRPSQSVVEVCGKREFAKLDKLQEFPELEQQLHSAQAESIRMGFDGILDVKSRFWWEIYFMAFEANLPQELRYTY